MQRRSQIPRGSSPLLPLLCPKDVRGFLDRASTYAGTIVRCERQEIG